MSTTGWGQSSSSLSMVSPLPRRVERLMAGKDIVVLRVSGRIEAEHVDTLRKLVEQENGKVIIDLSEVTLVNREAIGFLALSKANGVELRNCADYILEWVARESGRVYRSHPKTGGEDDIG